MLRNEDYPGLTQLFVAYFNQDWNCEFGTPERVIKAFLTEEPPGSIDKALAELPRFSREVSACDNSGDALHRFGCYYDPQSEGMTVLQWLERVEKELNAHSS